jgi:hypothetical protein
MQGTHTLDHILNPDRVKEGWSVREPDDHILELLYQGEVKARFSQCGVTTENLEHEIGRLSKN